MKKLLASIFIVSLCAVNSLADTDTVNMLNSHIPEIKRTVLDKYLTSNEAYKLIQDDAGILFIDVRDSAEIGVSGHPVGIDAIVPLKIQTTSFDADLDEYRIAYNQSFLAEMADVLEINEKSKDDMIIITCGSGMRSAEAVNILAKAGYSNAWHITDGYVGDDKPGLNLYNAWKIAGLPWTNELVHGSEWRIIHTSD